MAVKAWKKAVVALLVLTILFGGCGYHKESLRKQAAPASGRLPATRQDAVPAVEAPKYSEQIDVRGSGLELDTINSGIFLSPDGRLAVFSGSRAPRGGVPKGGEIDFEAKLVLADLVGQTVRTLDTAQYIGIIEWSSTGDKILYRRGDSRSDSLYVADVSGNRTIRIADRAYCGSISPDGRKVAYVERGRGIFVAQTDGTDRIQLTSDDNDWYPVWYPDGASLLYFNGKEAGSPPDGPAFSGGTPFPQTEAVRRQGLARLNLRTGVRENIMPGLRGRFSRAAWIVPGQTLYVIREQGDRFTELIVDISRGMVRELGENEAGPESATFLDRANGLVYKTGDDGLVVYNTAGKAIRALNLDPGWATRSAPAFAVSPDGAVLAYLAAGESGSDNRQCVLRVMDAKGGKPRELTGRGYYHGPVWTPDGSRVVVAETGGDMSPGRFILRIIPWTGRV